MGWWRDYSRWRKFEDKIRDRLPSFHPESGAPLAWNINIYTPGKFDPVSGCKIQSGLSTLSITQRVPRMLRDRNVYSFDWKKQKLVRQPGTYWR